MCKNGHNNFVTIPINRFTLTYRYIKAITIENRVGSLRNHVFAEFRLCTCSNTMHGHREGLHSRGTRFSADMVLCNKCDGAKHPEWYAEDEAIVE